ncbi:MULTISPECIES: hypothetical protein [unclassified Lentimonas]|uniref:hypothetical protein n=1 Tax=unclassified Lentimonas TaxID=2630993 RepID=UPI00132704E0|nr:MULTISPECIES: hypothetical protein [unclassified Lentimonas]CAA6677515.1 Unannotated [Lentimonas sp. CC4]CAA6686485.1 Unannotated [Lentimonas sp. CC6]CAA6690313.1 Unannotated [Lentimonas sp. CC19]CAA6690755.1 Unannotated [Lentimonas sp. CC10]CAA7068555.1 Unannotated [Lentimonas sp. CC11]
MMLRILLLGALLGYGQMFAAETWTLTDKQGRDIVVDKLFYDGVELSVRRVGAYNKIKIAPELLSKKCWAEISKEMAKDARITLEVVRRTKTSTDTDRNTSTGYYTYTDEEKEVKKANYFEMNLGSSSHFVSDLRVEYFIISEGEVDCGRLFEQVSFAEPVETQVSKVVSHTERSFKSSYGYSSSYKSGDSKAGIVVLVYNTAGDVVAEYATSNKLMEEYRGMANSLRNRMKAKPSKKKNKNKSSPGEPVAHKQVTFDKDLL